MPGGGVEDARNGWRPPQWWEGPAERAYSPGIRATTIEGEPAIQLAQDRKLTIHLLITDIVMPGMQGFELADLIKTCHVGIKVLPVHRTHVEPCRDQNAHYGSLTRIKPIPPSTASLSGTALAFYPPVGTPAFSRK